MFKWNRMFLYQLYPRPQAAWREAPHKRVFEYLSKSLSQTHIIQKTRCFPDGRFQFQDLKAVWQPLAKRRIDLQTIFPILRYENPRAAMKFLCEALGFKVVFCVPETGEYVRHARLSLSGNVIMLGSVREDEGDLSSPLNANMSTQALSVYVQDIEAHHAHAKSAGANIIKTLYETDFGSQEYHVRDKEGHLWFFGTYLPNSEGIDETLDETEFKPVLPTHSEDGVDLTLIRWMLSLTPLERLQTAQNYANSVMRLRNAKRRS